ncbi:MAG: hypothetical protein KDD40_05870 [Bdellovibrionales bacterium]|nr:hypothetical protein [Bdellovibrionales bacterium]
MKFMTLVLFAMVLSACSMFQRHPGSGYADYEQSLAESNVKQYYNDKADNKKQQSMQEIGLDATRPLTENEAQALNYRIYLNRLEDNLVTERERKQYYYYKPMLKSDADRIRFLKIPSVEARERFAQQLNLVQKFNDFDDNTLNLIEDNDIAIGMNQQAVKESWGDPDSVEVAGREVYGNQAWKYTKMVSSNEGYKKETRIIYFEAGRVIGWESL